jgi:hypothetical protein
MPPHPQEFCHDSDSFPSSRPFNLGIVTLKNDLENKEAKLFPNKHCASPEIKCTFNLSFSFYFLSGRKLSK